MSELHPSQVLSDELNKLMPGMRWYHWPVSEYDALATATVRRLGEVEVYLEGETMTVTVRGEFETVDDGLQGAALVIERAVVEEAIAMVRQVRLQ